tara:strand:- start:76 stop:723 length:648 start_codon:yes stop_codon:yes gene_type:complete
MKVIFITLLPIFLLVSCGPQDGTERQGLSYRQQQGGGIKDKISDPNVISQETSKNFLAEFEQVYSCGERWYLDFYGDIVDSTKVSKNSIQRGRLTGLTKRVYLGVNSTYKHIIYVEQVLNNETTRANITLSFCKSEFPGIWFQNRTFVKGDKYMHLDTGRIWEPNRDGFNWDHIYLDGDADEKYNSVDKAFVVIHFERYLNRSRIPVSASFTKVR